MKTSIRYVTVAVSLVFALPICRAADDKPEVKEEKKGMRVLAPREHRVVVQRDGERKQNVEKETVAFLGVETASVSATTSAQLGLPRGTGLVVSHVLPNSPAAGVLNEHDILLRLDDQILIETRQLLVLIRNHKEGDEVALTYLRAGQKSTAKLKLGKTEVPKMSAIVTPGARAFAFGSGDGAFEWATPRPDGLERGEWDRVLSLLDRTRGAPDGGPGTMPPAARIRIDHSAGPGLRAMSINTGNSNMIFSDDEGSLELTMRDGAKTLVAKNAKGDELFSGPVTTLEERKAMPAAVRERLEKLEGMHGMAFHTDQDFKGTEMKVFRPRGIGLPLPWQAPLPPPPPAFY